MTKIRTHRWSHESVTPPQHRLRVLHLGYEDHLRPGAGGGSRRTREINERLSKHFDVTVVTAGFPGCTSRIENGIRYEHIGSSVGGFVSLLSYFAAIPLALIRFDSDIVIEDFGAPFSSVGVPWMTRRPTIGIVQWLFAREKSKQYKLPFFAIETLGVASHRSLIAVSSGIGQELRLRNGDAKVYVVSNGLDQEAFSSHECERNDILYLGRLEIAQKGLDLLLESFRNVVSEIKQNLLIAGDGPDRKRLEDLVALHKLQNRVRFIGRVDSQERFNLLASVDFVVMPSRYESFGMVAAEALAVSTPVLAFDIPCLGDLINVNNGALVAPFDIDKFASEIIRLSQNSSLRRKLGQAGPDSVKDLTWERLAELQAEIYLSVSSSYPITNRRSPKTLIHQGFARKAATASHRLWGDSPLQKICKRTEQGWRKIQIAFTQPSRKS